MLNVILYHKSSDVFEFSYLRDKLAPMTIVAPNPNLADHYRVQAKGKADALTIAKFVKDFLQKSEGLEEISFKRKSELLMVLGTIWKSATKQLNYELFMNSFNTFTEIRSFTMEAHFLQELDQFVDPEIARAIQYFWMVLENQNIHDEHSSYNLLTDQIRHQVTNVLDCIENYIFHGFSHLSANQIDFLKAMAIKKDVYIPFPAKVYHESKESDWIKWIGGEIVELEEVAQEDQINVQLFEKGSLKNLLNQYEEKSAESVFQILLAQKNPTIKQVLQLSIGNVTFKGQIDLFDDQFSQVKEQFLNLIMQESKSIKTQSVIDWFNKSVEEEIETQNFRKIKIIQEYLKVILSWHEMSELNDSISVFDVKLLSDITELNLPRNSMFMPVQKGKVFGLESIESVENDKPLLILARSGYTGLSVSESSQQEDLWELYKALGPIRRQSLEVEIYAHALKQLLKEHHHSQLLIDHELIEHDLFWAGFIEGEKIEKISYESPAKREKPIYYEAPEAKVIFPLSVSNLQTLIDCPLKYYVEKIEKIKPYLVMKEEIQTNEIGSLEHKILELFFKPENTQSLESIIMATWSQYKIKNKLKLRLNSENRILHELTEFCKNGVEQIKAFEFEELFFEKDFESELVKGQIDCIGRKGSKYLVLDFKRSKSSIPSKKDLMSFRKIQLWHYSCEISKWKNGDVVGFGYINLSEAEDSLFIVSDSEFPESWDESIISKKKYKEFWTDLSQQYEEFIGNKLREFKDLVQFKAHPLSKKACTFCSLSSICHKGMSHE